MEIKWTLMAFILLLSIVSNGIVEGQSAMTYFNPTDQTNSLINDDVIISKELRNNLMPLNNLPSNDTEDAYSSLNNGVQITTRGPENYISVKGDQLVYAACNSYERVLGGGFKVNFTGSSDYQVLESYPSTNNSWVLHIQSDSVKLQPLVQCGYFVDPYGAGFNGNSGFNGNVNNGQSINSNNGNNGGNAGNNNNGGNGIFSN